MSGCRGVIVDGLNCEKEIDNPGPAYMVGIHPSQGSCQASATQTFCEHYLGLMCRIDDRRSPLISPSQYSMFLGPQGAGLSVSPPKGPLSAAKSSTGSATRNLRWSCRDEIGCPV